MFFKVSPVKRIIRRKRAPASVSHVVGFDDAPFNHHSRRNVLIVGTVFAGLRMDGVLSAHVRRDGVNSTDTLIRLVQNNRFFPQLQAVLLQEFRKGRSDEAHLTVERIQQRIGLGPDIASHTGVDFFINP